MKLSVSSQSPSGSARDAHTARPRAGLRTGLERGGIVLLLFVLIVVFTWREPAFLSVDNLFSILQAASIVALLAVGVTITLAVGGFDLSVGSTAATAQMAASYVLVVWHGNAVSAVLACLLLGVGAGLFNGLLITRLRVPDQLATLGTLFLLAGLQLIPTGGRSLATGSILPDGTETTGSFPAAFLALGRRYWQCLSWNLPDGAVSSMRQAATKRPRGWRARRHRGIACWLMLHPAALRPWAER
jgi:simple sugar transport system permease protein